jgi:lysophospholipase L1-like esterase
MNSLYPYDLIILQFGLNAVNEHSGSKWFSHYQQQMGSVISRFKRAYPNASILVVSMPDRGSRQNGQIVTMRGVEGMVACQQRIAMENKVAFLNFFQMMGGRNSIAELVNRRMVGHDYTHPSYGGGRLLATKMMASLMAGYE